MKIIQMVVGLVIAAVPLTAMADLVPSAGVGDACYSESGSTAYVRRCYGEGIFPDPIGHAVPYCPPDYGGVDLEYCHLRGSTSTNEQFSCGTIVSSCNVCLGIGSGIIRAGQEIEFSSTNWTTVRTGVVSQPSKIGRVATSNSSECVINVVSDSTVYGCAAGYYTANVGDSTNSRLVCFACPDNATCGVIGNTEMFKCKDGYYAASANATTCTKCPSVGSVEGKTGKLGATSITECYVPGTALAGSDDSGSYTYNDDKCNYKN